MKTQVLLGALLLAASLTLTACDSAGTDHLAGGPSVAAVSAPLAGAIFTTEVDCDDTNVNQFASKADVYVDGGPRREGSAGLPDGAYWIQVTEPDGALLGRSSSANVQVVGGEFVTCYQLQAVVELVDGAGTPTGTPGYATTTNGGGVYKVWVSTDAGFAPSASKTDNFKVADAGVPPPDPTGTLTVLKYYDANADGDRNNGETEIDGWKILIDGVPFLTRYMDIAAFGTYNIAEAIPVETNWFATEGGPFPAVVSAATPDVTVEFGNVCVGAGGGHTLGFWSNKNGKAVFDALSAPTAIVSLTALNLRTATGGDFDPANYAAFRTWILGATATNMAYMLSAQLAAMHLNVRSGDVSGSALIYAPGTASGLASGTGFATVDDVMAEANASLGTNRNTPAGHDARAAQEALKNALDNANNNRTFVQPTACTLFTFAD